MWHFIILKALNQLIVKGFTLLCLTWAAFDGDGLVIVPSLWIPPEV